MQCAKNPDLSRERVGLIVSIPSEQNRNIGEIPFLGHIWILTDVLIVDGKPSQ